MQPLTPAEAIDETRHVLKGLPVFGAGGAFAAEDFGKPLEGDLDLFVPTPQVLMTTVQQLLDRGYVMDEKFSRVWYRWQRYGFGKWHTNSIRLESLSGVETNVVYKLVDGHPTTSLAQVLESFDLGMLAVGWDYEHNKRRDLRPYLFPNEDVHGELGLNPLKLENWVRGFISQYNGVRQPERWARYYDRDFPVEKAGDQLAQGYRAGAPYHLNRFEEDKRLLGDIWIASAELIEARDTVKIKEAAKQIGYDDPLTQILDALS